MLLEYNSSCRNIFLSKASWEGSKIILTEEAHGDFVTLASYIFPKDAK